MLSFFLFSVYLKYAIWGNEGVKRLMINKSMKKRGGQEKKTKRNGKERNKDKHLELI